MEHVTKVLKELASLETSKARADYGKILRQNNLPHRDLVQVMVAQFSANRSLGLSEDEKLKIFALFRGNPVVREALSGHFSQKTKESNPKLFEDVGTSFTSTANVAQYPVPIGTLYRKWLKGPKSDKRKKSV